MTRNKRVQKQIQDFQKDHSIQEIKLLDLHHQFQSATFAFTGPLDSPYEGYWFRILVQWPEQYPLKPLQLQLIDKIWNPYVDFKKDLICIDILKDQFLPSLTTSKILLSIISLLSQSKIINNDKGFANPKAASQMMNNYPFFYQQARKYCQSYSYQKDQLYKDCQRGIPEDHFIKAQGKQLLKLVEKQSRNYQMAKKTQQEKLPELSQKSKLLAHQHLFGITSESQMKMTLMIPFKDESTIKEKI